ncbi:hypothetical protein [Microbacterium sp. H1-D42]|uniref:hypothetical protein n=1 Tax=Microbacterium sp. H1-D42 TaxID=2925844 RepID=UPI001F532973|nr:hypothetical protein [Microbacterium sp. H1-D42]UNK70966.1 hypothetical protein MNR00_00550 [Microbacterium sp. H1-D42]
MSTLPVTNTLTSAFVPIAWAGAVIAIICAIALLIALASGAAGLTAGAVGAWFVGALMSVMSSFASEWTPLLLSGGALAAALVIGGMVRMLTLPRPVAARAVVDSPAPLPVQPAMSQAVAVRTQPVKTARSPVAA